MTLEPGLRSLLGADTAAAWETLSTVVPSAVYLGGGTAIAVHLRHRHSRDLDFFFHEELIDLDALADELGRRGPFAITQRSTGTLNGLLGATPIQFLRAGLHRPERQLGPAERVAGLSVAGLGDLLAMKLNAIAGRAQLRDYFDLLAIERDGGRSVEEGLALFLARYQPDHPDSALLPIILALGNLDDVPDDPFLPMGRDEIADYWARRQPEVVASLDRFGKS